MQTNPEIINWKGDIRVDGINEYKKFVGQGLGEYPNRETLSKFNLCEDKLSELSGLRVVYGNENIVNIREIQIRLMLIRRNP